MQKNAYENAYSFFKALKTKDYLPLCSGFNSRLAHHKEKP